METIGQFEASRHSAKPLKLFLFDGSNTSLESLMRSVAIGPGATEFGYGTTIVRQGSGAPINNRLSLAKSDFVASIDELRAISEDITHVSLAVAWQATDLRVGECRVLPKVGNDSLTTVPYAWQVGNVTRSTAMLTAPNRGGAPSDRTIYEAIRHLRQRGIRVTVYPMLQMDIAAGNGLPDPYGATEQTAFPWRGRITCHPAPDQPGTVDGTSTAANQVSAFFGSAAAGEFGWDAANLRVTYSGNNDRYRRFILHLATIAAAADATGFLIGSEMVGLTRIRGTGAYPAVTRLATLAADVRTILGDGCEISYAADWSEYHSHRVGGDVTFNMDPLWSDPNIDFIGIDNYLPTTDWRSTSAHADRSAGFTSIYDLSYQQAGIEGGEYYDWGYADQAARSAQIRSPIADPTHGKPWVFRLKDIRNWWLNQHVNRVGGTETGAPTGWVPQSKPIVFTALGCRAIDKGSNWPAMRDGSLPFYSSNRPDPAVQRAFLEAHLRYWATHNPWSPVYSGRMLRMSDVALTGWDARPYPLYPQKTEYWGDSGEWLRGHWLTGRLVAGRSFDGGQLGPFAFCDGEAPITRDGVTFEPWPIKHGRITSNGTLDKSDLSVTMAAGSELDPLFVAYPPSKVVNLTIFEGHVGSDPTLSNFPAIWIGRVSGMTFEKSERIISCQPISTTLRRPGLRRNYQVGCPHVLYGEQCRAIKAAATYTRTATAVSGQRVTIDTAIDLGENQQIAGGLLEWTNAQNGRLEIRTIARVEGRVLVLRGLVRGLDGGATVRISRGCNHQMGGCRGFSNILNYGGQPFIPRENPLSSKNQFY